MLFEYPTVAALAKHLSEESADSDDEARDTGRFDLPFGKARLGC